MENPVPSISVVMAVYNSDRFVSQSIESILKQTFSDFELIIIDDASTDNTSHAIDVFRDKRVIKVRNSSNLGQTKSLNIGFAMARGRYIARMDADDIAYPQRLQLQCEFLEQNPQIAVVGSWSEDIDENGRVLRKVRPPTEPIEIKCFMAGSGDLSYWCITHPTVLIRKDVLEKEGFYDEKRGIAQGYPQDYELWSRLIRQNNFANIKKILLQYRVLKASDSRYFREEQVKTREAITLNQIQYYFPNIKLNEALPLLKILEYQRQDSPEAGKKAFTLFDQYMQAFMGEQYSLKIVQRPVHQMKLYYTPKLFISNKLGAIVAMCRIFSQYPVFILDGKFYRKLLRVFSECALPQNRYQWLKEIFSYR